MYEKRYKRKYWKNSSIYIFDTIDYWSYIIHNLEEYYNKEKGFII